MDIFINNLKNSDKWNSNPLNKHWLILNSKGPGETPISSKVRFFILDTLDSSTTEEIKNSISSSPEKVIFTDGGDIQWGDGKKRSNRWSTDRSIDNNQNLKNIDASLRGPGDTKIYYYDENSIMSSNLKYILYLKKDGNNENYVLLYNPLHRQPFLDYYSGETPGSFGATSDMALKIFPNYCNSLLMNEGQAYLDPSCNTFIDETTCQASAFAQDNATYDSRNLKASPKIENEINTIGAVCVYAQGSPTLKYGQSPFFSDSLNESFIFKNINTESPFQLKAYGNRPASLNITNQVCQNVINTGGNVEATNANIETVCGISPTPQTPTPTDKIPVYDYVLIGVLSILIFIVLYFILKYYKYWR